ncbi:unnamed protein product, partial [Allacma fusca]
NVRKAFTVGPEALNIPYLFPSAHLAGTSTRKARARTTSEYLTSDENTLELSKKEKQKKTNSSSRDSEERRYTLSA